MSDVDGDDDEDMILHFETRETNLVYGQTNACLDGETYGGTAFHMCDSVRIVGPTSDSDRDSRGVGSPFVFGDDEEASMRTKQNDNCPNNLFDSAWPPDFTGDRTVDIVDFLDWMRSYRSFLGHADYAARYDLAFDGSINSLDFVVWKRFLGATCS
jgi:hypothetical protein